MHKSFDTVIVDEFHNVKNRNTIRAKLLDRMKFKYNIYLSGTPILNRLEELWFVLSRINPDEFGNYNDYVSHYSKKKMIRIVRYFGRKRVYHYITKFYGGKNIDELQKKILPFFIRRRKKEVMKWLPPKIFQNVYVEMKGKQRKLYDSMLKGLKIKINARPLACVLLWLNLLA
jgi:SNF2 family DNA or RNA helicase